MPQLYRKGTWRGAGSFWSPDPTIAETYGRGPWVTCRPTGAVLTVGSDEDLATALAQLGVADAAARVLDADWLTPDVFAQLQRHSITWVVKPVDPSVSAAVEWVYVGAGVP